MASKSFNENTAIPVLVFNPLKRFIGVFKSCASAASAFDISPVTISLACTGKIISAHKLYFRYWDNTLFTFEDIKNMTLLEWDKANGLIRKYYPNKNMTRNGMKYKKRP